ncbi:transmembrane protein, putative (macronuclear) [Tetrahymena thermophila SB210]|uniref:Transmembrane protein, putative n=1 Tax=Tetrahymena thermophila (strain SB210) TaxID=312017 RepID=I7LVI8_TETTS|nr:transmembrane protein, putative [Tetrahymena thermophila SB210]EAR98315.2 transmembrane protein, putative [Tetrahymena thermophila SB210]|eukprot:XP_001018560.2 transmembrane protein, putative [Tetrahymena thermophila SB210]
MIKTLLQIYFLIYILVLLHKVTAQVDLPLNLQNFIVQNCINDCKTNCQQGQSRMQILGGNQGAVQGVPIITYQQSNIQAFYEAKLTFNIYYIQNQNINSLVVFQNQNNCTKSGQTFQPLGTITQQTDIYQGQTLQYNISNSSQLNLKIFSSPSLQFGIDLQSIKLTVNYCKDPLCSVCDSSSCSQCKDNAQIVSGSCVCQDKYYWDDDLQSCLQCDRKCKKCQFFSDNCTECDGNNRDITQKCACFSYFQEIYDQTNNSFSCKCLDTDNRIQLQGSQQCVCKSTQQTTGYFQLRDQQKCEQCAQYCQVCDTYPSKCSQCSYNRDPNNGCNCLCGFYKQFPTSDSCVLLPKQSRELSNGQCKCKQGFYENNQPDCDNCLQKCVTCVNKNSCQTCQQGRDINNDCQCLIGYYEFTPLAPTCGKCDYKCSECITSANNCTKCRGDRINAPQCQCPIFKFDNNQENCLDCDLTCQTCSGSSPTNCLNCMSDRIFNPSNKSCECKQGLYHVFKQRQCGQCSQECLTCVNNKFYCTSCKFPEDFLFEGNCYCDKNNTSKIRQQDGSCSEPNYLTFQIYSTIDQIKFQNLIIIEFDEDLILDDQIKQKLQQILQIQQTKIYRNLKQTSFEDKTYFQNSDPQFAQFIDNQAGQRNLQQFNAQFIFESITSNSVKFRVVSSESFSDLDLKITLKNTEFAISKSKKRLSNANIAKFWNINLANQYNLNSDQTHTQQQLQTMESINNLTFFGVFQHLYLYFILMPGFQIMAIIQILPIQLPPNLYNVCRMFNLLTFQVNFEWGLLNYNQQNTVYNKAISSQSEDNAIPQNFRRLGFSSNFFNNCLEIIILIIIMITITFILYLLYSHTQDKLSKLFQYKSYITKAFNFSHNVISYYIEATIFFLIIGFWLNAIYVQNNGVNIFGLIFSIAVVIFLGYFFTYQACLIQLKTDMVANRHMSNFLLICFWYQKFFKLFRYVKKVLILSILVIFNFSPISQMVLIMLVFFTFLVLSIVIRPYMYKVDNIILILNDSIQAILSVLLLTITILYEKKINSAFIISQVNINQYIIVGWVAVSFISLFAILNVFYQLYNLKRIFDFIFKDIHKNQFPQKNNQSPDQSILRKTLNQEQLYGIENIQDEIIQQADKNYLEFLKNQRLQKLLDDEKRKYFENVTLQNQKQSLTPDQMRYIKALNRNSIYQNFEINPANQQINNKTNVQVGTQNYVNSSQTDINQIQFQATNFQQPEVRQNYEPQYLIELVTNQNYDQVQNQNINQNFIINPYLKNMRVNQAESPKDQFQTLENEELEDFNYEPIFSQNSASNYQVPLINNLEQQSYQQQQQIQYQLEQNITNQANNQNQNIQQGTQQFIKQNENEKQTEVLQIKPIQNQNEMNIDKINELQKQQQQIIQTLPYKEQNQEINDQAQIQNNNQNHENENINNNLQNEGDYQNQNAYIPQQQPFSHNQLDVIQENFNEQDSNYYSPDQIIQRISEYKKSNN